ncbi:Uncharacterized protein family Cys-rich, partial [Cynara cardunculus var. scolymus]
MRDVWSDRRDVGRGSKLCFNGLYVVLYAACMGQGCVYCVLMMFTCHWLYACLFRERLRAKYGLPADPCNDCCVHFCCHA